MISDKRLFEIMIKYHPTFIGWLIKEKKIEKDEDRLVEYKTKTDLPKRELIKEYKGRVFHTYSNGVRRIPYSGWCGQPDFTKIRGYYGEDTIIDRGFDLFDIGNTSDRYCLTAQVEDLLIKCYDIIADISLPQGTPRFRGESASSYIKWLERRHELLKEKDYKFGSIPYWGYIGVSGFSSDQPKVIENIKKHSFLAYKPIYQQIEWSFDLVERYKNQIVWKLLMEESNLVWNEDMLIRYDNYIPFCLEDQDTYCGKFNSGNVLENYSIFGSLSNDYLESHKERLNWMNVFAKCKFNWNGEEMKYFCQYALSIDMPYSNSFRETSAASQIEWSITELIENHYFQWTSENLLAWLLISENNWKALVEKHRPNLFSLLLDIPNIKEVAEPHVKGIDNFWDIVCNKNDFPYDELTEEFTIENIKNNIQNWSKPLNNIFLTMRRTPDTNYYYYYVETQWDIYWKRKNIPLTYELAKYLLGVEIKLGGTYMESDGGYIEEDHRFPTFNALEAFSNHHIASLQDKIKCLEDNEVVDILLRPENNPNIDLIKMIIDDFFQDYQINDYINIINGLKDWDNIKYFNSDEQQ